MTSISEPTPPAALRFLRTEGTPIEVGRDHGSTFGSEVLGSIGVYRDKFDEIGITWERALSIAQRAGDYLRTLDPALVEELDGIAQGADVDPREILTINIRTGITRMIEEGTTDEDHECTTAAVLPEATANGHTLVGQNWDQRAVCQPNTVVIEQHIPGQPALLFVTEAGILFRHGMNDAGIGIAGNALRTNRESRADQGAPSPVPRRRALRERTLAAARRAIEETPRSHSGNHLVGDAAGAAVDIEAAPGQTFALDPKDGILVHSNHFLHPEAHTALEDRGPKSHPDTLLRDCRLRDTLREKHGSITVADVQEALKDHDGFPVSVCRHPNPDSSTPGFTLVSTVMDLNERRMWTAPGPACVGTYTEYSFS
ncbi:MAG: C45 family peptidase [Acidimicrobiia bacterium]